MDLFDIVAARAGGSGGSGAPQVQSDWEQNDSSKKDYIKNRTHWKEEIEVDYVTLEYNGMVTDTVSKYNKQLGLVVGQTYTCDLYSGDTLIKTIDIVARECPIPVNQEIVYSPQLVDEEEKYLSIIDSVDFVANEWIVADSVIYEFYNNTISKVYVHGISSIETVIHKLPNEYIDNQETTYKFNIESLSNEFILDTQVPKLICDYRISSNNSLNAIFRYELHTAIQSVKIGEIISTLIDIPAQYDDTNSLMSNYFNNFQEYSNPCIYNRDVFGGTPVSLDLIGWYFLNNNYITNYKVFMGSSRTEINSVEGLYAISLRCGIVMTFPSEEVREAVYREFFTPIIFKATHYSLTYKTPTPVIDII